MLIADKLACRRGKRFVFQDLAFTLTPGSLMLVTGQNGSGKSSLLRMLAGLLPISEGQLSWQGATIDDFTAHRSNLHYLGHLDAVKPELTVSETIRYWRALRGETGMQTALEPFGLEALWDRPVKYLSAGQKRRLALTRLTMGYAPLWLLDEPTTALDQKGQELLIGLIKRQRAEGGIAIIATHQHAEFENAQHLTLGPSA